jgi:uncharacterized protein (DUF1015 family)
MPQFIPFKALVPSKNPEKVSAPPYDVLSFEECMNIAKENPNSFVRISRAEVDFPEGAGIYSDKIYEKALENFQKLKDSVPYAQDNTPNFFIYKLKMGEHVQFGIAALASVKDYENNKIKKHEKTRKDKEDDRTRHILKIRSHSGPVLFTYNDDPQIDAIVAKTVSENKPFIDFTAENGVVNVLWRLNDGRIEKLFSKIPAFYIADGHHRAASAARAAKQINASDEKAGSNYFIAAAFPASQMKILPYNRLLKNFNGKNEKEFINFMKKEFEYICEGVSSPSKNGQIAVFIKNKWLLFSIDKCKDKTKSPQENLDAAILQDKILSPFFGIQDPRTDKRIDFVGGIRGTKYLEDAVKKKEAAAAFSMFPVSVKEIMNISDTDGIMPPKSTWFEPKLRDGLLLDEF